ncbi:MAG: uncharacterized protein QG608_2913 [Actinomycetota bacterium]|nr:uncharacterized protein [Actinomycetota bacterium]
MAWLAVLRVLAAAVPDRPCVIVLDEVPWLADRDDTFYGALQTAWDRLLSPRPVLLLLLGSDVHMMERMSAYDQPFYGRADTMVLGPLTPPQVGTALELGPAEAIDAYLITGGLPGIVRSWRPGDQPEAFLREVCDDPASPVFSVPESALQAEFPSPDVTSQVLLAVGAGERTQARIAEAAGSRAGAVPSGTLSPILRRLVEEKRVLALEPPLSTKPGRPAMYRVADPNLRLYLAIRQAHELSRRGRPDAAYALVERRWSSWRGRAVEPVVRTALEEAWLSGALPVAAGAEPGFVGGWWNRTFSTEVDLVGADRGPVAERIVFAGSVKWHDSPVDTHDVTALRRAAGAVPGAPPDVPTLMVSLSGRTRDVDPASVTAWWGPADVIGAWQ